MDTEQYVTPTPNEPGIIKEHPIKKYPYVFPRYFSWTAVFAGALVAIGLGFLSHLLIAGIALITFTGDQQTLFILTMVGLALSAIFTYITLFIGGWVAGRLAKAYSDRPYRTGRGVLHGFITWCLALAFTLMLVPHLGKLPVRLHLMPPTISQPVINNTNNPNTMTTTTTTMNIEAVKHRLGEATLVIFSLFLLGAIASAIGGGCGIKHRTKEEEVTVTTTKI